MARRKRSYPRSRGQAEDIGSLAIRSLLDSEDFRLIDLAGVAGVHITAAGRWLYGCRPSRVSAARLQKAYPKIITAQVMAYWGYEQC